MSVNKTTYINERKHNLSSIFFCAQQFTVVFNCINKKITMASSVKFLMLFGIAITLLALVSEKEVSASPMPMPLPEPVAGPSPNPEPCDKGKKGGKGKGKGKGKEAFFKKFWKF